MKVYLIIHFNKKWYYELAIGHYSQPEFMTYISRPEAKRLIKIGTRVPLKRDCPWTSQMAIWEIE